MADFLLLGNQEIESQRQAIRYKYFPVGSWRVGQGSSSMLDTYPDVLQVDAAEAHKGHPQRRIQ